MIMSQKQKQLTAPDSMFMEIFVYRNRIAALVQFRFEFEYVEQRGYRDKDSFLRKKLSRTASVVVLIRQR